MDEFNRRLLNFNYGFCESDHPVPILRNTLEAFDRPLRQSASQTLLLMHILHISLKLLIKDYLIQFVQLYGDAAFIPKIHFLVHYPEQILAVGPLVCTWTMRHEAKLNFFKQASRLANFKNIPYSLASRHQRWMCYEHSGKELLHATFECGPPKHGNGVNFIRDESEKISGELREVVPSLSLDATVFRPTWVKTDGITYKLNAYLVVDSDGLDPIFGRLDDLLVVGGNMVIFVIMLCKVLYFDSHYHAYRIMHTSNQVLYSSLFDTIVYHAHTLADGFTYIAMKCHFFV